MQEPKLPAVADDDSYEGSSFQKWQLLGLEASKKLGVPLDLADTCKSTMEEVGFVDVTEVIYKWPTNKWPADKKMKEIGMYSIQTFHKYAGQEKASFSEFGTLLEDFIVEECEG